MFKVKVQQVKHHRKALAALAVGAALAMGPGIAAAGAIGTGYLGIFDLIFYKTNDGGATKAVLSATGATPDITPTGSGFTNSADTSALINGAGPPTRTANEDASPAGLDVDGPGFSCAPEGGTCNGYVNNSFTYLVKPQDVPGGSYALGDISLTGAAIDLGQGPGNVGADAQALAESAVNPSDVGTTQSNLNLNASFEFVANSDFDLLVEGSFIAYLRAALLPNLTGIDANASIDWTFSLRDVDAEVTYSYNLASDPEFFLGTTSASDVGQDFEDSFSGGISFSTINRKGVGVPFLVAGNEYQLTLTHKAAADSQAILVPEPASLALLGIALAGLGVSSRRKRR